VSNGISHFVIIAISWVLSRVCECMARVRGLRMYAPEQSGPHLGERTRRQGGRRSPRRRGTVFAGAPRGRVAALRAAPRRSKY